MFYRVVGVGEKCKKFDFNCNLRTTTTQLRNVQHKRSHANERKMQYNTLCMGKNAMIREK